MPTNTSLLVTVSNDELLAATRKLVLRTSAVEAELLVHLGEIDERKLYSDCAYPSMFAFCVCELGFSEDATYSRILVARAARRLPAVLDSLRCGRVHLSGLRLLVPHLTVENHGEALSRAAGKSKRQIEELIASLAPQPPVPAIVRKLPAATTQAPLGLGSAACASHRPMIAPLSEETYRVQFTASRALRDKLRHAQDLLRHRVPDGDPATIVEKALDLLIERVEKERFAIGRKAKAKARAGENPGKEPVSRYIPASVRRAVVERDTQRCTYVGEQGNRCPETGGLEFDHVEGFARKRVHSVTDIRLRCKAHNFHAAVKMYGRTFMERARASRTKPPTCPGTSSPIECIPPAQWPSGPQTSS